MPRLFVFAALVLCAACAPPPDARCQALCVVGQPAIAGVGDVCSAASTDTCAGACMAHISEQSTLCASCLLERAAFEPPASSSSGDYCDNNTCTTTGRAGSCDYPQGDEAARQACLRQVTPLREVACTPTFRPVVECAAVCGTP